MPQAIRPGKAPAVMGAMVANRLAKSLSPYLRQHEHNPVDWYPWGSEALEEAKAANRPILLSIGYSACHWCHVMEHETFSDPNVASEMNDRFINIKVDREERPDLDDLYMKAVQAFTGGRGGWPMTVFLTPDGVPFFGGTYFPAVGRHGMPSFRQILDHASSTFDDISQGTSDIHVQVLEALRSDTEADGGEAHRNDWLDRVVKAAEDVFDRADGGFGGAPKFPPHATISVLLAHYSVTGRSRSLRMATETLSAMARGGMYDHLGGGFSRYSVDGHWRIPHFEKMLYDNAQLVPLYIDAFVATKDPFYARIAEETLRYLDLELSAPNGGFYAAEDADSEGEEGAFYVWTPAELIEALGPSDGPRAAQLLQVTPTGTFENGTSVLRLEQPLESLSEADARWLSDVVIPTLRARREHRTRPPMDTKIVTSWNGLAVRAFAHAGRALNRSDYVERAARCAEYLLTRVMVNGRLHRVSSEEHVEVPAFLDDYANVLNGVLALWEATWHSTWLDHAESLAEDILRLFDNDVDAALDFTGQDAEALIHRSKHLVTSAEPAGNAAAALAFTRLSATTGDRRWADRADKILTVYSAILDRSPRVLGEAALAGHWRSAGGQEIGIIGSPGLARDQLTDELRTRVLPFATTCIATPSGPTGVSWMDGRVADGGKATAYLCQEFSCAAPVTSAKLLGQQLDALRLPAAQPRDRMPSTRAPALPIAPERWLNTPIPIDLESRRGSVVILDFWTFCCVNCLHVLPELAAVEDHFEDQPVTVIGVHSAKFDREREASAVQGAIRRHRVRHPVVLDPDHELWSQYAVRAWPTIVIIDPSGRICWQKSGEVGRETLIEVVEDILEDARDQGALSAPEPLPPIVPDAAPGLLSSPGKLLTHAGANPQSASPDPFGLGNRLFISNTGRHQILECALRLDDDGWPQAELLRTFGTGDPQLVDGCQDLACFRDPQGMALVDGELYVADTGNHCIRAIDLENERVRTIAGTGRLGGGDLDAAEPLRCALRSPWDLAVAEGIVFIAMAGTHQIWVYTTESGRLGPFLGSGREAHIDGDPRSAALAQPSGVTISGNNLFIADSETSSVRAFDFTTNQLGTILGRGLFDFGDVDGPTDQALMQHPLGLAATTGHLFVADTYNGKVKRIRFDGGQVETIAAGFHEPADVATAGDFLLVADTEAHRVAAVHLESGEVRPLPILGG